MRTMHLLVIAAVSGLACNDSSAPPPPPPPPPQLTLDGPAFMSARVDTSRFSLDSNDAVVWWTADSVLVINGEPGQTGPEGFAYIDIQIGPYRGPGTYTLALTNGSNSLGFYGVFAGSPPVPVASYQTMFQQSGSWGTVRIIDADTARGIVGEFSFVAERNDGGTGNVQVREGSFRTLHHLR